MTSNSLPSQDSFKISPIIQLTLMSLYIALVIPLPFLAEVTHASVPPGLLWVGFAIGAAILCGGLSERVEIRCSPHLGPKWVRLAKELWVG